jgi:hypothetical protein
MVLLGALGVLGVLGREGIPQVTEAFDMAVLGDSRIPPFTIRVMRDGTEAEIAGGIKYGLADAFEKTLNAARRVKVVHLTSNGGRIGEGEKLFKLIRERGLDTYVASTCMSACTLAFAGGRQRFLLDGGSLGFHKSAFAGESEPGADRLQRQVFRAAGFEPRFVDRAVSTPNADMWTPARDVLVAAKVVTAITGDDRFAYSGFGDALDKASVARRLAASSATFAAMQERFPDSFERLAAGYHESIVEGLTRPETVQRLRAHLRPFIFKVLPLADDDVLLEYNRVVVGQYVELGTTSATACYRYASGAGNADLSTLSAEAVRREQAVQERIIRTAAKRSEADKSLVDSLWAQVRRGMLASGVKEADLTLVQSLDVEPSKHALYCAVAIRMFQEIGRLPQGQGAILMRELLTSN